MFFHSGKLKLQIQYNGKKIIGVVLIISAIISLSLWNPTATNWLLIQSPFLVLLAPILGFTLLIFPNNVVITSFKLLFDKELSTKKNCKDALELFNTIENCCLACGLLGSFIQMSYFMKSPNINFFYSHLSILAIILLPTLYGIFLKILFFQPLKKNLQKKLTNIENNNS